MLDKFKKEDLIGLMTVTLRSGHVETIDDGFDPIYALVDVDDYNEDLLCVHEGRANPLLDIMQVSLPSGAVLWERKEAPALPDTRPCSGCARLESDPICGSCLRHGHGATVDFYQARAKA